MFEKLEKSNNITLKCPLEKRVYQIQNWLFDANKIIPKSLVMPGNISFYLEFLTKSNSSENKMLVHSLKVLMEYKKR
jgi:hypothetical protein